MVVGSRKDCDTMAWGDILSVKEAAQLVGLSRQVVQKAIEAQRLPAREYTIGGRRGHPGGSRTEWRIQRSDLELWRRQVEEKKERIPGVPMQRFDMTAALSIVASRKELS